jgi:hypothetical protein
MPRLAKSVPFLAILATLGSLVSCDQSGTAPESTPPRQDTTKAHSGSNDVLQRALPLALEPAWVPVRTMCPQGGPNGSAWYSLDVESDKTYRITLRYTDPTGVSLLLFDGDSSLLAKATMGQGTPGTLQLQYETDLAERLYLVVNGLVRDTFEVKVEILPGQTALPDAYEAFDTSAEVRGGPLVAADSTWINRTLHRTAGGDMESGDLFELRVDSGKLYSIHLLARGNMPSVGFLPRGILPIDTHWTHSTTGNTRNATLSFPVHRSGTVHFAATPVGPNFKPVHYRVAVTAREGIPSGVYPDLYESDDTPETASLLFPDGQTQSRTLHRSPIVSDTDEILLLNLTESNQILEIQDSLQAIVLEAFTSEGTPLHLPEVVTGSVRCFVVPPPVSAPIRIRLANRRAEAVTYRIELRAP